MSPNVYKSLDLAYTFLLKFSLLLSTLRRRMKCFFSSCRYICYTLFFFIYIFIPCRCLHTYIQANRFYLHLHTDSLKIQGCYLTRSQTWDKLYSLFMFVFLFKVIFSWQLRIYRSNFFKIIMAVTQVVSLFC